MDLDASATSGNYNLKPPASGWSKGRYRLDLLLDGARVGWDRFEIK